MSQESFIKHNSPVIFMIEQRWELSILELEDEFGRGYQVTRRLLELCLTESKMFRSKRHAKAQFERWLP